MHYYKRHLGDYARDTGHLTALEHGIYGLLLDWYYANEKPIPADKAARIARGNPDETQSVLSEFFELTAQGWKHRRADREIREYNAKADRNRTVGKLGGRPPKTQTVSKENPRETLTKNQEPLTNKEQKQKTGSPTGSRLPPDWVLPDDWRVWAEQERPDLIVQREADSFADYWHGVAGAKGRKADWKGTWRNWIRRADGMRRRAEQQAQPSARMGKLTKLEEMKHGLGNSGNHHGDATLDLLGPRQGACLRLGGGNGSGMGGGG